MYRLDRDFGTRIEPEVLCSLGDQEFGCTAHSTYGGYPYSENPISISIDDDYLLDVVTKKTQPTLGFASTAIKAQAVAARTFTYYFDEFNLPLSNDTDTSQVFVPYAFDYFNGPTAKQTVEQAVGIERYMSYNYTVSGETLPIRSEYSSDIRLETEDCDFANGDPIPYQRAVDDPISSHPDVQTFGNPCGMSQKGASRWAFGNLAFDNDLDDWSTQFIRYEQILVHYYTGVHLRVNDSSTEIKSSEYRWNPLEITWSPASALEGQLLRLEPDTSYSGTIQVQNTSTDADGWKCDALLEYRLLYRLERQNSTPFIDSVSVCDIARGKSADIPITLTTPSQEGIYSLRFDVIIVFNGSIIQYFSEDDSNGNSWREYGMLATVGDETEDSIYLPLLTYGNTGRVDTVPTSIDLAMATASNIEQTPKQFLFLICAIVLLSFTLQRVRNHRTELVHDGLTLLQPDAASSG